MKKALRKILVLAVCICVFASSISVSATTTAGYTPYPKIEYSYSSSVSVGTIRYISQISSSSYFYSSYWGGWASQAGIECGTSSISMALSYVGINKTPKNILDKNNGVTYFDGWGVEMQRPSVANGMTNYINGNGKYSPPIVHFTTGYASGTHYVILIGKVSSSSYLVLDPASNSTWTLSTSDAKYKSIDQVFQYYNPDVAIQQPITETPEIRTDKEVYSPGENVVFIRNEVENTNFYQLIVYYMGENGEFEEQIYSESMLDVTQKLSFNDVGKYYTFVQVGNSVSGVITSKAYVFYVGNVITETPILCLNKFNFACGEEVRFTRNTVENATQYNLVIWLYDETTGAYEIIVDLPMSTVEHIFDILKAGEYMARVYAVNSISETASSYVYFNIENEITEAPILYSDKTNYAYGEDVTLTRNTVENATQYDLVIWLFNETTGGYEIIVNQPMSTVNHIFDELEAGEYMAQVYAYNSIGETTSEHIYFYIVNPITEAPILYSDKTDYAYGEYITLTRSTVENASAYKLNIEAYINGRGYQSYGEGVFREAEITFPWPFDAGEYRAKITAYNSISETESEYIYFSVVNPITEAPSLTNNKTIYASGEDIVLTRSTVENATGYTLHLLKAKADNSGFDVLLNDEMSDAEYTIPGLEAGDYRIGVTAYNSLYLSHSEDIYFSVVNPITETPTVYSDKSEYAYGEDVVLTRSSVKNATGYTLHIDKAQKDGSGYYRYTNVAMTDVEITFSGLFDAGEYRVTVTANNSVSEKESEYIYFNVVEPHTHSYVSTVTKAPTCTTYGIMTYVCSGCSDSYAEPISKANHVYSPDYTVDTPATYFAAGIKSRHCLNCTASTDHTVIEPLVPPASLLKDIRKLILKGTNNTQYDYNGDGEVDIRDLVKLKKSYCGIV